MANFKMPDGTPYLGQDYVMPDTPPPPPPPRKAPPGEPSFGPHAGQRALLAGQHISEHMAEAGFEGKLVPDPKAGGYRVRMPDEVLGGMTSPYGSSGGLGSPDFDEPGPTPLTPEFHDPGWFAHDPLVVRAPRRVRRHNINAPVQRIISRCIVT